MRERAERGLISSYKPRLHPVYGSAYKLVDTAAAAHLHGIDSSSSSDSSDSEYSDESNEDEHEASLFSRIFGGGRHSVRDAAAGKTRKSMVAHHEHRTSQAGRKSLSGRLTGRMSFFNGGGARKSLLGGSGAGGGRKSLIGGLLGGVFSDKKEHKEKKDKKDKSEQKEKKVKKEKKAAKKARKAPAQDEWGYEDGGWDEGAYDEWDGGWWEEGEWHASGQKDKKEKNKKAKKLKKEVKT